MGKDGCLIRESLLGRPQARTFCSRQVSDLVHWKIGEVGQQAGDVPVIAVDPELVVLERRRLFAVKPDAFPRGGLAHLLPGRCQEKRRCQRVGWSILDATDEVGSGEDIRPLVASPQLQGAPMPAECFQEVVRLQEHVIELEKGQSRLEA